MAKRTSAAALLEQLEACGEATLAELDEQIAAEEQQLAELTSKREAKIAALKSVRKVIDVKVNGKPARKKPQRKAEGEEGTGEKTLKERLYDLIVEKGPLRPAEAARELDCTASGISSTLKCGWFEKNDDGQIMIAQAQ